MSRLPLRILLKHMAMDFGGVSSGNFVVRVNSKKASLIKTWAIKLKRIEGDILMKTTKIKFAALASVLFVSACSTSLNELIESSAGVNLNSEAVILTDRKIASCWTHADLPGNGYETLTPSEALGLTSVDGASDAQVQDFKSCLPT